MRQWLSALSRRAEVDRAVLFGVLTSGWQFAAAPVTLLFIARNLTGETQGFYYAFASLLALQTYVELGLSVVLLNRASHEWARLGLDGCGRVTGDADAFSRLVSLGRFAFVWYSGAGLLFVLGVGLGGHLFFSRASTGVGWQGPWWSLVTLTGVQLWALPFNALLEGCNQVATVQQFRLSQSILRSGALWLALGLGAGLWAAVAAAAAGVLRDIYLLGVQYRSFFRPFLSLPRGPLVNWSTDVWPMQWRLAVSGTVSYFLFQAFTPVMFHYWGPTVAGQMGMTMSVVFAVQGLSSVWLQPKIPRFGMLIADEQFGRLDDLWWGTTRAVVATTATAATAVWTLVWALNAFEVGLAQRLLPPTPTAFFLLGALGMAIGFCETAYLRAHRQEPIFVLSVVTSLLMGATVWALGSRFGSLGAAAAYLIVAVGVSLPWETTIWLRCRADWHGPQRQPAAVPALGSPGARAGAQPVSSTFVSRGKA